MNDLSLIWCHGSLSQPWGEKSKHLADVAKEFGLTMDAVDFQSIENPDERVDKLRSRMDELGTPVILAGSSMGGYVAATAAKGADVAGLFLLAPAFYLPGYDTHVFSDLPEIVTVIHGWNDDVVPVDNSIRFAGLHKARLALLPDGHRLSESLDDIGSLFSRFLYTIQQRQG